VSEVLPPDMAAFTQTTEDEIFAAIRLLGCLSFLSLEWWILRKAPDYVREDWHALAFVHSDDYILTTASDT
jgi:hypothetical protein